jgi:regulator of sirC expression with transglutaminase-like and TPR domain
MANCPKCGREIEHGSSFCKNCGQKFASLRRAAKRHSTPPVVTERIQKISIGKKSIKLDVVIRTILLILIILMVTVISFKQLMKHYKKTGPSEVSETKLVESVAPPSTENPLQPDETTNTMPERLSENDRLIQFYSNVITQKPQNAVAYYNRGLAYINVENYQQAVLDLNKSIEINPQANAYVARGFAYDRLGNYPQALLDYDKAIEINPSYGLAYTNRGNTYYMLGERKKAVSDLKEGARLGDKKTQDWLQKKGISW